MRLKFCLLTSIALLPLISCGPKRLYDSSSAGPGDIATINIESSATNAIEDVVINEAMVSPSVMAKVATGDQQISFKYYYEDKDNPTFSPPFHGTCRGAFFARPNNTYSVTPSGVYLNEAKETRFWVIQPARQDIASLDCTRIEETTRANIIGNAAVGSNVIGSSVVGSSGSGQRVIEKDLSQDSAPKAKGMWDTIVEPFQKKDDSFDPTKPVMEPTPAPSAERSRYY